MRDYQSSSPPQLQASQESLSESLQSLKMTPEEKAGTISGSTIAIAVALCLKFWDVKHARCKKIRN